VVAGDAQPIGREPMKPVLFAHHTVLMSTLTRLPSAPCLPYGDAANLELQLVNSFSAELGSTKPRLPPIWTATGRRVRGSRQLQKKCVT